MTSIPLFYWSEEKFAGKARDNYGDLLSKYLVEKLSGTKVKWVHPKKQAWYKFNKTNYLAIGSIIHHATKHSIVWGSGIIDRKQKVCDADFRAVRGPRTRAYLKELGYQCPQIYGDPALLLPRFFYPDQQKKYKLGIIPHYQDYKNISEKYRNKEDILVIDLLCNNIEKVTKQILSCEKTISSSLHGLIVSHAYGIPSLWLEFSNKLFGDGVKFIDYLESVEMKAYTAEFVSDKLSLEELEGLFDLFPSLPDMLVIHQIQDDLLDSCPFF